ncbi:MAG TPA: hypothetical protein ENH30_07845 [Nitrospirae bacterium]|nr:hypothetical protein [Nitrospirota bacterium]
MKLMHVEEFTDIIEAICREKQIKGWSRRKKEAIIAGDYEELVKLPFDKACPERKEAEKKDSSTSSE